MPHGMGGPPPHNGGMIGPPYGPQVPMQGPMRYRGPPPGHMGGPPPGARPMMQPHPHMPHPEDGPYWPRGRGWNARPSECYPLPSIFVNISISTSCLILAYVPHKNSVTYLVSPLSTPSCGCTHLTHSIAYECTMCELGPTYLHTCGMGILVSPSRYLLGKLDCVI